jgi:outer membrane translocation and assembly module TamA
MRGGLIVPRGCFARLFFVAVCLVTLGACASVPADRYGVARLRFEGVDAMDEEALRGCLSTAARPRAGVTLGVMPAGACGEEPFDVGHTRVDLWAWPWTEWPLYDRVALERDLRRIERWYEARGHHAARVVEVRVEPEQATHDDTIERELEEPGCEREGSDEGCSVELTIVVDEGEPTLVKSVGLRGHEALPRDLREELADAIALEEGERFDEARHDATKRALAVVLAEASHARARVRGHVRIDRPAREARVEYEIDAGPPCVFGEVIVEGAEGLPIEAIADATRIARGDAYSSEELREAQRAVFDLGAFASVVVEPIVPPLAEDDDGTSRAARTIDVRVKVTRAQQHRFGLGVGVQSGILERSQFEVQSVPIWDLHILARYTNRNALGGMRRLEMVQRPRLVLLEPFPSFESPRAGNEQRIELRQPGFLEPRTSFVVRGAHDVGPDPYAVFFRHRVDAGLSLERFFARHRLFASVGFRGTYYRVPPGERRDEQARRDRRNDDTPVPSDYHVVEVEEVLRLDLRDDPTRPHGGFFAQIVARQAGFWLPSSWDYVYLAPDVRAYVPLPKRITIAMRAALGMYFIRGADADLDPLSAELGPRDERLRGGGANGNRGFLPGRLGDGREGGTRRWEAAVELRFPITADLGGVLFGDFGDVSRATRFRFDHPQTSVGLGLRYFTIVGPIRLDLAWQVRQLSVIGPDERVRRTSDDTVVSFGPRARFPGAFHLSIGEAF